MFRKSFSSTCLDLPNENSPSLSPILSKYGQNTQINHSNLFTKTSTKYFQVDLMVLRSPHRFSRAFFPYFVVLDQFFFQICAMFVSLVWRPQGILGHCYYGNHWTLRLHHFIYFLFFFFSHSYFLSIWINESIFPAMWIRYSFCLH